MAERTAASKKVLSPKFHGLHASGDALPRRQRFLAKSAKIAKEK
jgi:hypothetical protein